MVVRDGLVFWSGEIGTSNDSPAVFTFPIGGGESKMIGRFTSDQAPYGGIAGCPRADWLMES